MAFDCFSTSEASIAKPRTLSRAAACPDRELWTTWKEARVLKTLNPLNVNLSTPYFPESDCFSVSSPRFVQERGSRLPFLARARHLSDLHVLSDGRLVFVCLLALCAVKARCVSSRDRRKACNRSRYDGCTTVSWFLFKKALRSHFPLWRKKKKPMDYTFPSLLHILQSLSSPRYLIGLVHGRLGCPLLVEALFRPAWCQL